MIVFKTFLKILNKNKIMFIFYTILLFSITMMNTTNNENNMSYVQSKPAIFIVNNDEELNRIKIAHLNLLLTYTHSFRLLNDKKSWNNYKKYNSLKLH